MSELKHNVYLSELLKLTCSPDLLALKLFPNLKEITESFGLYEAVKKYFPSTPDSTQVIVVGDGSTPRTAATFAFRSKWNCFSIDPVLRNYPWSESIKRLACFKARIEDTKLDFSQLIGPIIVVMPHSHVAIKTVLKHIKHSNISVVAMECCMPLGIKETKPDISYTDKEILSPHNKISIWKGIHNVI